MASWFNYYFGSPQAGSSGNDRQRGTPVHDDEADAKDTASTSGCGVSDEVANSLTDEQRTQIREVMLKAQKSHKDAKVVIDAKHLSRLRTFGVQHSTIDYGDEVEPEYVVQDERLIQMDSLPETLEVTVLPAPPPSIASRCAADKSSSQASSGRTSSLDQYSESQSPAKFIAEPSSYFSSSMCLLTNRINQWIKTLDTDEQICVNLDDSTINAGSDEPVCGNGDGYGGFQTEELFVPESPREEPRLLVELFVDKLMEEVVEGSAEDLQKHFEHFYSLLGYFGETLAKQVIHAAFEELRLRIEAADNRRALILQTSFDSNCSSVFSSFLFSKPYEHGDVSHLARQGDRYRTEATFRAEHGANRDDRDSDSEESEMCYSILSESDQEVENLEKSEIRNRTIVVARWIQSTFGEYDQEQAVHEAPYDIQPESPTEFTQLKYTRSHDDSGLFMEKSSSTSSADMDRNGSKDYRLRFRNFDSSTNSNVIPKDISTETISDRDECGDQTIFTNTIMPSTTDPECFDYNSSATSGAEVEDRSFEEDDVHNKREPNTIDLIITKEIRQKEAEVEDPSIQAQLSPVESFEEHSSATSGADQEQSFDTDYGMSYEEYSKTSPLLAETAEEEEIIVSEDHEEPIAVAPLPAPEDKALTEEEMAHIERVMKMAEQSSFERMMTEKGRKVSEPAEVEEVAIAPDASPARSFEEHSSATSGADQEQSFDTDYGMSYEEYRKTSPLLAETAEEEGIIFPEDHEEPIAVTPLPAPEDKGLTEEEMAHIERVMKMAEQSSFERMMTEKGRKVSEPAEVEEVAIAPDASPARSFEEHSSATSGADQEQSFDTDYGMSYEEYRKTSPLLAETAEEEEIIVPEAHEEPIAVTPLPAPEDKGLTEEEMAHIERVMKMAEQSSFERMMTEKGRKVSEPAEVEEVAIAPDASPARSFEEHSSATSGADQEQSFDTDYGMSYEVYRKTSPLLAETAEEEGIIFPEDHEEPIAVAPLPAPEDKALTEEEMAHIERVMKMAEQSSFERMMTEKGRKVSEPAEVEEVAIAPDASPARSFEEHSSATSGADQEQSFDTDYGMSYEEYRKTSPLLAETAEEEGIIFPEDHEEPIAVAPLPAPEDKALTEEEMAHIERVMKMAEQSSFERMMTEKGRKVSEPAEVEEVAIALDASPAPSFEEHSSATSGADQEQSFDTDYGMSYEEYRKTSPLLAETAEEEEIIVPEDHEEPIAVAPLPAPEDKGLTEEEMAHIERVMKMAEQSSFERMMTEKGRKVSEPAEVEEVAIALDASPAPSFEEHSSATSGADQEQSFDTDYGMSYEEYRKTSPLLAETAEEEEIIVPEDHEEPIAEAPLPAPEDKGLTEEEMAHIERVMKMAEQSSFERMMTEKGRKVSEPAEVEEVAIAPDASPARSFEEHSSATSGADQEQSFDTDYGMSYEEYRKTSPLLAETAEEEEIIVPKAHEEPIAVAPLPAAEDKGLTEEEMAHIERVMKMAEQSSFERMMTEKGRKVSEPAEVEEVAIAPDASPARSFGEHSSATSGADQEQSFDTDYGMSYEEYRKTSPLLAETAEEEEIIVPEAHEEPIAVTPLPAPEDKGLTEEEMAHIERVMKMAEQSSFERMMTEKGRKVSEPAEVEEVAIAPDASPARSFEEHSSATSGADQEQSFDTDYGMSYEEYRKTSPLLAETAEEEEIIVPEDHEEPIAVAPLPAPEDKGLTEEEMAHIERVMKMAEQSSFERMMTEKGRKVSEPAEVEEVAIAPDASPARSFEEHSSATSGADQEQSFDTDYGMSYEEYRKTSPLLAETAEEEEIIVPEDHEEPIAVAPLPAPEDKGLTEEEMAHIERVMKMAEQSSFERMMTEKGRKVSEPAEVEEVAIAPDASPAPSFEEHSSATSGADQEQSFDTDYGMSYEEYRKTSPLLAETAEEEEIIVPEAHEEPIAEAPLPAPEDKGLTDEEMAHIERVMKMAEQSSFERMMTEKGRKVWEPAEVEEVAIAPDASPARSFEEHSSATSGADQEQSFDTDYGMSYEEYRKTSPLLAETAEEEEIIVPEDHEEPIAVAPLPAPEDKGLTEEEMAHIERVMKMAEQSSFERMMTEKGRKVSEPAEVEEVAIALDASPAPSFEEHSSATSGADQEQSFDTDYGMSYEEYRKTSPLLAETAEEEEIIVPEDHEEPIAVAPLPAPEDKGLTEEEMAHIERVMKMAEQSSFERMMTEKGRKVSEPAEVEEVAIALDASPAPSFEEHSSATSGADQEQSFDTDYGMSYEEYRKTSPLLAETAEEEEIIVPEDHEEPIAEAPLPAPEDKGLTEEEMAHIERVMKMAEQSSFERMMTEKGRKVSEPAEVEEVAIAPDASPARSFEEHSSATSGADQEQSFDTDYGMSYEEYRKTSPLLAETAEEEEIIVPKAHEEPIAVAPLPAPEDKGLTEEEMAHIERVMKMAEQSSFERMMTEKGRKVSEPAEVEEVAIAPDASPARSFEEHSSATSGADQEQSFDTDYGMSYEEYRKTSPLLAETAEEEEIIVPEAHEEPIAVAPLPAPEDKGLTEEEMAHIERVMKMAEQSSFERMMTEKGRKVSEPAEVEEVAIAPDASPARSFEEHSSATSGADQEQSFDTDYGMSYEEYRKTSPLLAETAEEEEIIVPEDHEEPIAVAPLPAPEDKGLTEEEMAHIERVMKMAEQSSFERMMTEKGRKVSEPAEVEEVAIAPDASPARSFEEHSSATSGADQEQSFDTDYGMSYEEYRKTSPLLAETAEEEEIIVPEDHEEPIAVAPLPAPEDKGLTEEEMAHIERVMKMAEQSSFERMMTEKGRKVSEPAEVEEVAIAPDASPARSFEEHSSATSGADQEQSFDTDYGMSYEEYRKTSPLLAETAEEEEIIVPEDHEEPIAVAPLPAPEDKGLTEEEMAHIERVMKMAEQSSFERMMTEKGRKVSEPAEVEEVAIAPDASPARSFEEHSSATSGADQEQSFDTDYGMSYEEYRKTSPLLAETAEEEEIIVPEDHEEPIAVAPLPAPEDKGLTEEEMAHIERVMKMAEQSSFERMMTEKGRKVSEPAEVEEVAIAPDASPARSFEEHSSATSGADQEQSFDTDYGMSYEEYRKTSPLLAETAEEEEIIVPEDHEEPIAVAPLPAPEDKGLTEEEMAHIERVMKMAEQSSFERMMTEKGRKVSEPAEVEEVAIAPDASPARSFEEHSSATSGADQEQSFDTDYGMSYEEYRKTSPLLAETAEEEEIIVPEADHEEPIAVAPLPAPEDKGLTEEEMAHIERVMKMAEQSSFERMMTEKGRKVSEPAEVEEVAIAPDASPARSFEEHSSATSGADQEQSFDTDYGMSYEEYRKTSPLLAETAEEEEIIVPEDHEEPIAVAPLPAPEDKGLTEEEMAHIERVMKMAEQSSFERMMTEKGRKVSEPAEVEEVAIAPDASPARSFEEHSSATSGADQEQSFDTDYGMSYEEYRKTSPLLAETAEEEEIIVPEDHEEPIAVAPLPAPEDKGLTEEEMAHIERVMKMAEQSSFERMMTEKGRKVSEPAEVEEVAIAPDASPARSFEEHSSATSGADQVQSFDTDYAMSFEEYRKTSPLLAETAEEEEIIVPEDHEEPIAVAPLPAPEDKGLTEEEMAHIERVMKMAEQSSFERMMTEKGRKVSEPAEVEEVAIAPDASPARSFEEHSSATSGADQVQSFDTDYAMSFEEYRKTSPLLAETAEEEEIIVPEDHEEPIAVAPLPAPEDKGLTEEEMAHIERVMKMAEQSSFERMMTEKGRKVSEPAEVEEVAIAPDASPARSFEEHSSATSGADQEQSFDTDYGMSFEEYRKTSPLLAETAEEEEIIVPEDHEEPIAVAPLPAPEDKGLTEEEMAHIERVMKMAEQSSFERMMTEKGRKVSEPAEVEEVAIAPDASPARSFEEHSSATSGADQEQSFDTDYAMSFEEYRKTSPLLAETAEEEEIIVPEDHEEPIAVAPLPAPEDKGLTEEEMAHIERVMKMAEQSSFERMMTEKGRKVSEPAEVEEVAIAPDASPARSFEEHSSATSGADQEQSFDTDYGMSFEEYRKTSPLLAETAEEEEIIVPEDHEEPIAVAPLPAPEDKGLTEEEMAHIERVMKMAEQSSFERMMTEKGRKVSEPAEVEEVAIAPDASPARSFEEHSSATSGADQEQSFDTDYGMSFEEYTKTSPLLAETAEEEEIIVPEDHEEPIAVAPLPAPEDKGLTEEEMAHIERVMKMAEQSSFERMMTEKGRKVSEPAEVEEVAIAPDASPARSFEEHSSATSGADQEQSFDTDYGMSYEEYRKTSPLLAETAEEEEIIVPEDHEEPIAVAPLPAPEDKGLTEGTTKRKWHTSNE
ncbi:hypothetical protein QR680_003301 [Steinernema hermaphroditum]|uniref:Uncharacterized protein n=1 Tax=Steinernema hermaphroditum TaxID=289476 RepID=A0AA39LJF7_9BILA|nr:hypothetical protein QR680_003301 [Steinernema hermaphroditum]